MQSQVPRVVAEYFGISEHPPRDQFPIIEQYFVLNYGFDDRTHNWRNHPNDKKRISISEIRRLRREERAVSVAIRYDGRLADFSIRELLGQPIRTRY